MTTSALRVVLLLALASTAAAADATTLRGTHGHKKRHHSTVTAEPQAAAVTEAVNTVVVKKAVPAAAEPGKTSTIKLEHTMTTGENLGQNVPYMGIDYLGTGYDILKGNPDGDEDTKIDPGFRRPVVYLTWGQNDEDLTRDMAYLQPREGWAMPETSCNMASSSSESSSMSEYTSELSVAASLSAGYAGVVGSASFSASAGYSGFSSDVAHKEGSRYSLRSYCVKFKAGLNRGPTNKTGIHPVASFETQAKELPMIFDCDTDGNKCIYVKNVKSGKYLTVTKTGDAWKVTMSAKESRENMFAFSSTDTGTLVHAASGQAIRVDVDASGVPQAVSVGAENQFAYSTETGSLTCTNCQKAATGGSAGAAPAPVAAGAVVAGVPLYLTAAAGVVTAVAGADTASAAVKRWSVIVVDTSSDHLALWTDFFADYGTHFIDSLHLGGKMIFTMTMSKESKDSMASSKVDVAASFEGEYGPVSGSVSASVSKSSSSNTAYGSAKKTMKTIVLGGNPPGDPRTGFGEWAESVDKAPMPVKYTLRPLTEAGSAVFAIPAMRKSYDLMLKKYMDETTSAAVSSINSKVAANKGPPTLLPGASWDMKTVKGKHGYSLELRADGTFGIMSSLDAVLWDSLATSGSSGTNGKLTYKKNGELVMSDAKGVETWTSLTASSMCGGEGPKQVTFIGGVLKITGSAGTVLWTSGTKSSAKNVAKQAEPKYFGRGQIKPACNLPCATLYTDVKGGGTSKKFSPGKYPGLTAANQLGSTSYSYQVTKGECYLIYYAEATIGSSKPTVSTHTTSTCGSGFNGYSWTTSRTAACGGAGNIAYGPLSSPACTTGASWAAVQYPESLAVVAAWDKTVAALWDTISQTYGRIACTEPAFTLTQRNHFTTMTRALQKYIKSSCMIGYHTAGTPQC